MPDKHTITCHRCGKEGATRFGVRVGRGTDAAGSMEDEYEDVDLCPAHVDAALREQLQEMNDFQRGEWVKQWQKEIPAGGTSK